jgi:hypothetical protein
MDAFIVESAGATVEHNCQPVRIPKGVGQVGLVRLDDVDYFLTRTGTGFQWEKVSNTDGEIMAVYQVQAGTVSVPGVCECGDWTYRGGKQGKKCKHLAATRRMLDLDAPPTPKVQPTTETTPPGESEPGVTPVTPDGPSGPVDYFDYLPVDPEDERRFYEP